MALLDGPLWPVLAPADAETVRGLLRAEEKYNPEAPYGRWWTRHDQSED